MAKSKKKEIEKVEEQVETPKKSPEIKIDEDGITDMGYLSKKLKNIHGR